MLWHGKACQHRTDHAVSQMTPAVNPCSPSPTYAAVLHCRILSRSASTDAFCQHKCQGDASGYGGRSSTSSRHRLLPLCRRTPGRRRKSTHPLSQARTKVSKPTHLGAGTAILSGISCPNNKRIPRTGRDLGLSWRAHPAVQKDLRATATRESETGGHTLWLGLDVIPGASPFVSSLKQPSRP